MTITPKDKAKEIVNKYIAIMGQYTKDYAKLFGQISVDEMYWMISQMPCDKTQELNYLLDVEEEIKKL
jgi:hypothetical protein